MASSPSSVVFDIGVKVYVDEGDSLGQIEYIGNIHKVHADSFDVKLWNGAIRRAAAHTVEPF